MSGGFFTETKKSLRAFRRTLAGIADWIFYFTRIFQPVMMRLTFLMSVGLSFWIAATVVPYFRAMAESVSPDFTVYQTAAGAGFFRSSLIYA